MFPQFGTNFWCLFLLKKSPFFFLQKMLSTGEFPHPKTKHYREEHSDFYLRCVNFLLLESACLNHFLPFHRLAFFAAFALAMLFSASFFPQNLSANFPQLLTARLVSALHRSAERVSDRRLIGDFFRLKAQPLSANFDNSFRLFQCLPMSACILHFSLIPQTWLPLFFPLRRATLPNRAPRCQASTECHSNFLGCYLIFLVLLYCEQKPPSKFSDKFLVPKVFQESPLFLRTYFWGNYQSRPAEALPPA